MSTHLQTCVGVQGQDFVFFKHSLCNFTKLEGMCVVMKVMKALFISIIISVPVLLIYNAIFLETRKFPSLLELTTPYTM